MKKYKKSLDFFGISEIFIPMKMTKNELKDLIKECVDEVLNESQHQKVFTIQEMMEKGMLNSVPEIEINESEYNRIVNESIEVDNIEEIL